MPEPNPTVDPEDEVVEEDLPESAPSEKATDDVEHKPKMVDINSRDEKGRQQFFHRRAVEELRKENASHRQRNTELETKLAEIEAAQEAARIKELQDQKRYEELAGEWERKHNQLSGQIAREKINSLRIQVGTDMGLPVELAKRLEGANEEEIRQDAERVMQLWITPDEEQAAPTRPQTTSAVPGGEPPSRNREDKRAEFFATQRQSPMFQGSSEVNFKVKDKRQFGG